MALNGNILLPSFFCQWSGVSGQSAVLLAPALDLTLALSGRQRGDEEQEGERLIRGPSTSGLAAEEPPGRPGNGWRGLSGLDSGSAASRGAGTREVWRLADFCTVTPFLCTQTLFPRSY